jgi:uncharacterized membrane protein
MGAPPLLFSHASLSSLSLQSNFVIDEAFESLDDIWGADMADSPAPAPAPEPELPAVAKFIEMKQKMVGAVVPMPTIAEPIEAEMAPAPAPDGAVYDDFSIDY